MESLSPVVLALFVVTALVLGVTTMVQGRRRRADQFHLRQAGRPVTARVAAVEPMDRTVNRAAGHAVTLALPTGGGYERTVRDTSGLGGYVAREGSEVTLRVSPDDPDLYTIEQIVGTAGPYPVRPGPHSDRSALVSYGMLAVALLVAAGGFSVWRWGPEVVLALLPPLFLIIGVGLLVGAVRSARSQRRLTAEATGVVTDVWTESQRRGGRRGGSTQVYVFTVHFFTPDGREVHKRNADANSLFQPQPQQRVTVRYNPTHPPEFALTGAGGVINTVVMTLIGVVFTVVGGCGLGVLWFAITSS